MSKPETAPEQILSNEFRAAMKAIERADQYTGRTNVSEDATSIAISNLAIARALVLVATVIDHRGTDIAEQIESTARVVEKIKDVTQAIERVSNGTRVFK